MRIENITNFAPIELTKLNDIKQQSPLGFNQVFTDLIGSVNQDQLDSSQSVKDYISGNGVELHEVMIAGEKAKTSLELLMEIRNKTVDMYKELTRMPI